MNSKRLLHLFLFVIFLAMLSTDYVDCASPFVIGDRKPVYNGKVETMKVVLRVEVLKNGQPFPYAFVHFFVDDEWVGYEMTDAEGIARVSAGPQETLGYHNWRVRVDKQGYDSYWSSVWRFNYQPRPVLTLESKFGDTFGVGNYTYGETASFGVVEPIIILGEGERLIFDRWVSYQDNGYTGFDSQSQLLMVNDIREIAEWKTQYYLDMSCDLPQFVYPKSGWYDEGDSLGIRVVPLEGVVFQYWDGSGNQSYSGSDIYASIKMNGPVKEQAFFIREEYSFNVESTYGNTWGSGRYSAWDNASFGVSDRYIYTNKGERWVFTGWSSDSNIGYTGNLTEYQIPIGEDIRQTTEWKKQYYVEVQGGEGGNVTTLSDWMDEGTEVTLNAVTEEGYSFRGWSGSGDASYTGSDSNYTLTVSSPINETANWKEQFSVNIESGLPATGRGSYLDGDTVTLEAQKADGLIVRRMFKQWTGDISSTNNPFTFTIDQDIDVSTVYEKNYTIFLGLMGVVILAVGIFFLRMIKE